MQRSLGLFCALVLCASACGDDDPAAADAGAPDAAQLPPLFEEKPECNPETAIAPLEGDHQMVISTLEIGTADDGFDLDMDGDPDNKLSAVGTLAAGAIEDSFENFSIVIPMEFFDFAEPGDDECVKFAIYLGQYSLDLDMDGENTADSDGDCNDHDNQVSKDFAEVPDNHQDDDCDGRADELEVATASDAGVVVTETPSTNTDDLDQDGVTIADGDCDDNEMAVTGPTADEVCGDGLDNDCDGNADWGVNDADEPDCSPYDQTPDLLALDPLGFEPDGDPVISFTSGTAVDTAAGVSIVAGPSLFSVGIPVTDEINLDLRITGATIEADFMQMTAGWGIVNGRLGGVIDANTADKVRGLRVDEINLTEENSLLDAVFANILGTIVGLPKLPQGHPWEGCQTPDIDVDRDGLEAFCDSDPLDDQNIVDVCIDGDGSEHRDIDNGDGTVTQCTEAVDDEGKLRFVDGISVELNFTTVPTILPTELPEIP